MLKQLSVLVVSDFNGRGNRLHHAADVDGDRCSGANLILTAAARSG